jgi:predicted nucleotidyltransferase
VTRLEEVLIRLDADLRKLRCRWALVGGIAVSVRARPRTTQDVDIAVAVSGDQDAERLVAVLRGSGYEVSAIVEQAARGRLATVRLLPPQEVDHPLPPNSEGEGETLVDLLFASSGIEPEIVAAAERLEIPPGLEIPVAKTGHLLAMKVLSEQENRPQDRMDALALVEKADEIDLQEAREAVELILRRGFDRGKDLRAELGAVLRMRLDRG